MDEDRFLAELLPKLTRDIPVPPGDDCAAIPWTDDELMLLAADQVAGDVHYHGPGAADPTPPELAGRKLLARNISDIAAMGGKPTYAILTIAATRDADEAWYRRFADGLLELADEYGVQLIGGDVSSAQAAVATLTIIGRVPADQVCRRDAARDGDLIVVTGAFGGSLTSGRHLTFSPRVAEAQTLVAHGCRCLIDTSDGLLTDLGRVCRASELQAVIETQSIPLHAGADLAAALTDGEDYELIAAISPEQWPALQAAWPHETAITVVGQFSAAVAGAPLIRASDLDLSPYVGRGFRHFDDA